MESNAALPNELNIIIYCLLRDPELRYSASDNTSGGSLLLIKGGIESSPCEEICSSKPCRTCAYDSSLDIPAAAGTSAGEDGAADVRESSARGEIADGTQAGSSYGVQILVLSRRLKAGDNAFKGYRPQEYRSGTLYKYVVGGYGSETEAREMWRTVRKKFPDSFPVVIRDGYVSPL